LPNLRGEPRAPSILAAGGKYVLRGGDAEVLEGEAPAGRTVVLEFPSRQAALAWYQSDEYTEIRKIREGAARARIYIVEVTPDATRGRARTAARCVSDPGA
jgi:uncharacterized protein (DUF1330 family)